LANGFKFFRGCPKSLKSHCPLVNGLVNGQSFVSDSKLRSLRPAAANLRTVTY